VCYNFWPMPSVNHKTSRGGLAGMLSPDHPECNIFIGRFENRRILIARGHGRPILKYNPKHEHHISVAEHAT
jgi:hypothetical protein